MKFERELLPGAWLVRAVMHQDARGSFVKTFTQTHYQAMQPPFEVREEFYSTSGQDVIRGMHFQLPPHDHAKMVYCAVGRVQDVLLDLRAGSGYGRFVTVELDAMQPAMLFIPTGIAHGFRSRSDGSLMVYKTSAEHAPSHDTGILWSSFGHDWDCAGPIVSARDAHHVPFDRFETPFMAGKGFGLKTGFP